MTHKDSYDFEDNIKFFKAAVDAGATVEELLPLASDYVQNQVKKEVEHYG